MIVQIDGGAANISAGRLRSQGSDAAFVRRFAMVFLIVMDRTMQLTIEIGLTGSQLRVVNLISCRCTLATRELRKHDFRIPGFAAICCCEFDCGNV